MSPFALESLTYQTHAVDAVVRVFEGTARCAEDGMGNRCDLLWAHEDPHDTLTPCLKDNLQRTALAHGVSDERLQLSPPEPGQPLDVCIEMETGTGKTLVYLKTLYALNQCYGWNKFIIVVPSLAIRAGVMGTLQDFGPQLAQQAGLNHPMSFFEYDSGKLNQLKSFIDSPSPAIMIMNSQAFVGQGRIISNEQNEAPLQGQTWLQALARCRPVVIMDEPQQGMDTPAALEAFADMRPLVKLRYSATHHPAHARNCVFRLTPAQAYEQGLVKKLEVLTIDDQGGQGTVQIEWGEARTRAGHEPQCKLKLWFQNAKGDQAYKASGWLDKGDDLEQITRNPGYAGWRIEHIHKSLDTGVWEVSFENGQTLTEQQAFGHDQEGIFRQQLHWLIHRHFEKKAQLAERGIKCLSLIFIDKVANYLPLEPGEPLIKRLFEEEYRAKVLALTGQAPSPEHIEAVQASYFARTGQGQYTDNEVSMAKNQAIYKDILTNKAALLQLSHPVEFIFSHSALGVGWDNPNVFNIATLRTARKEEKKRQELGRGLRICVNQSGHRVYDSAATALGQEINLLTVVPNQSYQAYAQSYQQEIIEAYGQDARAAAPLRENRAGQLQKKTLHLKQELFQSQAFRAFWQTLARTTRYTVSFDEADIVAAVVPKLLGIEVPHYVAHTQANRLGILEDPEAENPLIDTHYVGGADTRLSPRFAPQDWIQTIGHQSRLSQKAVFKALAQAFENPACLKKFLQNPVVFSQKATPDETQTPLVVDSNAVLPSTIAFEGLQLIARRNSEAEQILSP